MSDWASNRVGRFKAAWGRLGGAQRWLAAGLVAALLVAGGVGYYLNRPEWVVLVNQAEPRDAAAIVAKLQELKVPYRPTGDGYTIVVPKSEQYTAKLALAQAGLPKGGNVGLELFDEPKFGATDFDRRVNYLRAQQGELERALLRITELEYANVKLAIPEQTVFVRDQQPVTAAVMVQVRAGKKLTGEQVQGIVSFLSGSVQGLSPENVKVVDQTGRLLATGEDAPLDGDAAGTQAQRQLSMQRDLEQRVQTMLEPIFGAGNVLARVSLELSLDSSRVESNTVGNSTPKTTTTTRESVSNKTTPANSTTTTGAQAQGDAGAAPTYQGVNPTGTGTGDEWRTTTTTDFEVSQRKEVTLVSPGSVKKLSVGIAINRTDLTAAQVKEIKDAVAGATGAEEANVAVTAMTFFSQDKAPAVPSPTASGFKMLPVAVGGSLALMLLVVGYLLNRRRYDEPAFEGAGLGLPAENATVGASLNAALGLDDPLSVAAAAEPNDTEEAAPTDANAVAMPPVGAPPQTARERLEVVMNARPRRQITVDGQPPDPELVAQADDLIGTSPEAAAEVLRQWLKGGA